MTRMTNEELEALRTAEMDKCLTGEEINWELVEKVGAELKKREDLFKRLFL